MSFLVARIAHAANRFHHAAVNTMLNAYELRGLLLHQGRCPVTGVADLLVGLLAGERFHDYDDVLTSDVLTDAEPAEEVWPGNTPTLPPAGAEPLPPAGDVTPAKYCGDRFGSYGCSRPAGHDGPHELAHLHGCVIKRWTYSQVELDVAGCHHVGGSNST